MRVLFGLNQLYRQTKKNATCSTRGIVLSARLRKNSTIISAIDCNLPGTSEILFFTKSESNNNTNIDNQVAITVLVKAYLYSSVILILVTVSAEICICAKGAPKNPPPNWFPRAPPKILIIKTVIEIMHERLSNSKLIDAIIVAIPKNEIKLNFNIIIYFWLNH